MHLIVLLCSLSVAVTAQRVEDDYIDPYDMINYDPSTQKMRKPPEEANYPNVPTKRREYTQDSSQQTSCERRVVDLQKVVDEQKKKNKLISEQPTCAPVFKRFLRRLLNEIQRVGMPTDSTDVFYDAKVKLSKQTMTEIQTLLEGEDSWRTGALDNALSHILEDFKPHNYEAWKWRFEDTFGVEIDTLIKIKLCVLVLVAVIGTELWSTVSWLMQITRLIVVCFFVSIVWNWFYLYKTAFAKHQNEMVKTEAINEKCTGMRKIDWSDNLKEWFRSTWTLQDDPCEKYYERLLVNPILLVPPTKAISLTITTFFTEPLKHIGEGISDFIRALLKDLPVTLQIPVFLTVMFCIVLCVYVSVPAAFQYGIAAPFRRPRGDPPPPQLQQPQRHLQQIEDRGHLAGGDAPLQALRQRADDDRLQRNQVHRRRPNGPRQERPRESVETLGTADRPYSEDEPDAERQEADQNLSAESDSENQQGEQEEPAGASARSVAADTARSKTKPPESDSSQTKTKPLKENKDLSKDELSRDGAASKSQAAERPSQPSQTDVQDPQASAEDRTGSVTLTQVETVGVPVQESSPVSSD